MAIRFYDLCGRDGRRFSPFGWRARMALAHKGLEREAEVELVGFTEKHKLAFSGQELVPVIVDGDTVVSDSWRIACHLDAAWPDAPPLFGGSQGRGAARLAVAWIDTVIHPLLVRLIVADIPNHVRPEDMNYFLASRQARFGAPLAEVQAGREERLPAFRAALAPARAAVADQPFIAGAAPGYVDHALFGSFQWARGVSPFRLLAADDPLYGWRERMADLFDAMPRTEPGYPV